MTGEVIEVGKEVTQFRSGDLVWTNNQGYDGRQGTFAEYCCIDEHFLYHLPIGIDPYDAITVLHSGLTAARGLSKVQLLPGETLFINGGDGTVGTAVLQIAKALGARVIVTSGDEQKAQWCQSGHQGLCIPEELHYYSEQINQWLTKGTLTGKIAQKLPLSQAAQAHQIYETKNLFGKLVLSPTWETRPDLFFCVTIAGGSNLLYKTQSHQHPYDSYQRASLAAWLYVHSSSAIY